MSISLREEAERFVPEVERLIRRHGKVRMLVQMHGRVAELDQRGIRTRRLINLVR